MRSRIGSAKYSPNPEWCGRAHVPAGDAAMSQCEQKNIFRWNNFDGENASERYNNRGYFNRFQPKVVIYPNEASPRRALLQKAPFKVPSPKCLSSWPAGRRAFAPSLGNLLIRYFVLNSAPGIRETPFCRSGRNQAPRWSGCAFGDLRPFMKLLEQGGFHLFKPPQNPGFYLD